MLEVFVAFTRGTNLKDLEKNLEAWNQRELEPVAIQCALKKFELHRRITAENLARDNYILADMGNAPVEENFGALAMEELAKHKDVGLMGVWRTGQTAREIPNSVIICRKGVIEKWPTPRTETYIQEHVEACRLAGYKTFLCSAIHYRRLTESLPC